LSLTSSVATADSILTTLPLSSIGTPALVEPLAAVADLSFHGAIEAATAAVQASGQLTVPPDADRSLAHGAGLHTCVVGQPSTFTVSVCGRDGQGVATAALEDVQVSVVYVEGPETSDTALGAPAPAPVGDSDAAVVTAGNDPLAVSVSDVLRESAQHAFLAKVFQIYAMKGKMFAAHKTFDKTAMENENIDQGEFMQVLRDFKITPRWVSVQAATDLFRGYFIKSRSDHTKQTFSTGANKLIGYLKLGDFKQMLARLAHFVFPDSSGVPDTSVRTLLTLFHAAALDPKNDSALKEFRRLAQPVDERYLPVYPPASLSRSPSHAATAVTASTTTATSLSSPPQSPSNSNAPPPRLHASSSPVPVPSPQRSPQRVDPPKDAWSLPRASATVRIVPGMSDVCCRRSLRVKCESSV
jgi:hypothetical protein